MTFSRANLSALMMLSTSACGLGDALVFSARTVDAYEVPYESFAPGTVDLLRLPSEDGTELSLAVVRQADPSTASYSVVYLHGSGASLQDRWPHLAAMQAIGLQVLALDYRGFGTSAGEPSEEGLYADARAAFDFAASDPELGGRPLVVWGESLGSGVASRLMLDRPAALLVLEAAYTSIPDMIEFSGPMDFAPDWVTTARFDTYGRLPSIAAPVVIAHGVLDNRIPFWMAEMNFSVALEPKRLVTIAQGHHRDLVALGLTEIHGAMAVLLP